MQGGAERVHLEGVICCGEAACVAMRRLEYVDAGDDVGIDLRVDEVRA